MKKPPNIQMIHGDCMDYMAGLPDNAFDLAIVDPPYGIGESKKKRENRLDRWKSAPKKNHIIKEWDSSKPNKLFFNQLFRVSGNQIIWGGNYFVEFLPPSMGWIFWNKKNGDCDFSDGELAFSSFKKGLRVFEWLWSGFQKQRPETRIHPTQKPVALYKWLLTNYAKPGDRILDTHGGSGSIAIACYDLGFDLVWIEKDKDYYEAAVNRFKNHTAQLQMF